MTTRQDVDALAALLAGFPAEWWIAGGWALDLLSDEVTRAHGDIEVGIWRDNQDAIRPYFAGWDLDKAVRRDAVGEWVPWPDGDRLGLPIHQIRARNPSAAPSEFEFFLNEREAGEWVFRRDPSIRVPIGKATVTAPCGLRVLAPEIQLLYKARHRRPKDEADFTRWSGRLAGAQRAWLAAAIRRTGPECPWLAVIERESG